jgi:Skp family chaperone for outer membrane proteins
MRGGRGTWGAGLSLTLWLVLGVPVAAQDAPPPGVPILTLDQERLFLESAFGSASLERERAATQALEAENKRIEAELVAEEQELTRKRATMSAEEFAALADAFDAKVERIRNEQDAKALELTRARDRDRQEFLRAAVPVLGELLGELGAAVIVDKATVILSLSAIDITDEAIAKVDAALGANGPLPPEP